MLQRALELATRDPYVLWFRGRQAIQLRFWRRFRLWPRCQSKGQAYWTEVRAEAWLHTARRLPLIFPAGLKERLADWQAATPGAAEAVRVRAEAVKAGTVPLFGGRHTIEWGRPPWHADWRTGHEWTPRFYQDYRFYGAHRQAEVKFPWELSRLGWLQPVALAALLGEVNHADWIADRVCDWERANPCAATVNWYPMECSLRAVGLCLTLELMAADPCTTARQVLPLLRVLALQAEFVSRNVEYTEHGENHFAANVACLGLAGALLRDHPRSLHWSAAAALWLPREILGQFLIDGVNYEKSLAYHRLTAELFLLLTQAHASQGRLLPAEAHQRLRAAIACLAACRHPDGTAANFGDNDSARALTLGVEAPSQRDATLALAARYFADRRLADGPAVGFWTALFDLAPPSFNPPKEPAPVFGSPVGGFFAARQAGHALIADFGEVGLRGRGGHGHNDLFSFELSFHGHRLVVDAGCPIYTGDAAQYDAFRASASHNSLTVDGEEIAPLLGYWRIADEARPYAVAAEVRDGVLRLFGQHSGYARLPDPVTHRRELRFDARQGVLHCADRLLCGAKHNTIRRLHFAPGVDVVLSSAGATISTGGKIIATMEWDKYASARMSPYQQSPEFGTLLPAVCIELYAYVDTSSLLEFQILAS